MAEKGRRDRGGGKGGEREGRRKRRERRGRGGRRGWEEKMEMQKRKGRREPMRREEFTLCSVNHRLNKKGKGTDSLTLIKT